MPDWSALLPRLEAARSRAESLGALIGFDAAIDHLYAVVREREDPDRFTAFSLIEEFGAKVTEAAGNSALIEMEPKRTKFGGNGPIMASALAASSRRISCIGPFGDPPEAVFDPLAERLRFLLTVGSPARTHALEFEDGKIMLPILSNYKAIRAAPLIDRIGRAKLLDLIGDSRLVALLNWSCLPYLSEIFALFTDDLLPAVEADPQRLFFFDLADPHKHAPGQLRNAVAAMAAFSAFGRSVLGLNFNEAILLAHAFDLPEPAREGDALQTTAAALRAATGLDLVMIHPVEGAACAWEDGTAFTEGPVCQKPRITTGAGDNLNAGFCLGLGLGWPPADCLRLGVLFSGYYVRHARSPSLDELEVFIRSPIDP
ncbi:MAG: PfkB family carbohydrate kinase [Opitutales bacterium]